MAIELESGETPNERLLASLPKISQKLDELWKCYGNRYIGFAGGGNLRGELQPDELGLTWANEVDRLLAGCEAQIILHNEFEAEEWGEMIVSLSDLIDGLLFYFGPFWEELPDEERSRANIRMDTNARRLLAIFKRRGYVKEDKPFKLEY